jgi:flagellar hook-length control protein FliK
VTPALKLAQASVKAPVKSAWSKTLDWDALFASTLAAPPPSLTGTFAPLLGAQAGTNAPLISLVQNGTSLATIADRISSNVAAAVQSKLSASMSQSDAAAVANSVQTSLQNALAPPGNAPPGTAEQQVTALAARLQSWIANVAGESGQEAGQQNVLSGSVLDAKSAKELPAQQAKTSTTATTAGAAALANTLLSSLAAAPAQLQLSSAPVPAPAPAVQNPPAPANPGVNADGSTVAVAPSAASAPASANATDLLGRMIARAASVDATLNGASVAETAQAQASTPQANGAPAPSPSALAARFTQALAQTLVTASSNVSQDTSTGGGTNHAPDDQLAQSPASAPPSPAPAANAGGTLGAAAASPLISLQPQHSASAISLAAPVNTDAVVEQMVKAMSLRTTAQGASEIRLQLQPENLGTVTMRLTVQGTQISANVVAQNPDVGNALVANHQQLARSLANAGLTLSGFSVDVSGGDAGNGQNKDRTAGFGRRYVVHELGGAGTAETPAVSSLGPPLLPGSNLGLLNYLA